MTRYKSDLKYSAVTPKADFMNRRQLMSGAAGLGIAAGLGLPAAAGLNAAKTEYGEALTPNSWEDITQYNNFYEFGTGKTDPSEYAGELTTTPWTVEIDGMVKNPGKYDIDDIKAAMTIEERIYRFRCVEAWSMVVPWIGFSLSEIFKKVGIRSNAKYVAFQTLYRP